MKNILSKVILLMLAFSFYQCEILPDLSPSTTTGVDVNIYELNEIIFAQDYYDYEGVLLDESIDIDFDEDGTLDFRVLNPVRTFYCTASNTEQNETQIEPVGLDLFWRIDDNFIIKDAGFYHKEDAIIGNDVQLGLWKREATKLYEGYKTECGYCGCDVFPLFYSLLDTWLSDAPNGYDVALKSYLLIKQRKNNQDYFGWIELETIPGVYDTEIAGRTIYGVKISRVALATEPGIQLKAGRLN